MRRPLIGALLITLVASALEAQTLSQAPTVQVAPPRRSITAERLRDGERVLFDGLVTESFWQRAGSADNFIQQDPRNGEPATERTDVRIVYDDEALYIGATFYDSEPDRWLGYERRRDQTLAADDRFQWVLDPYLDGQNGYFFEINPSGLMGDGLISSTSVQNRNWDGIWDLRVRHTDIGWTVEIQIPFRTLNFDPGKTEWGINFQRTVRRKNEESFWNGWARNQTLRRLTTTGLLRGLENLAQGKGLDIRPYGVASASAEPGRNNPKTELDSNAGFDLFYSITPSLRANFTVNTDFAQTEVDQRQVNLTQYSLFFPERRTFFLEGAGNFDFSSVAQGGGGGGQVGFNAGGDTSIVPYFSRRIGLGEDEMPQKIDYGFQLTGQVGKADVGVLQVRTGAEEGVVGEDFTVVRVKRRMMTQSYVGALYTRRNPREAGASTLQTGGVDVRLATSRFRGSKNLFTTAFALWNTNPAGTGGNAAFGATVDYPNDRWNAGATFREVQEHFSPAVGFTLRNEYRRYNPYLNFSPRPANHPLIRRMGFTGDFNVWTDTNNSLLQRVVTLTVFQMDLHSQETLSVEVIPEYQRLDRPFKVGRDILLPRGADYSFVRYRVSAGTANRRKIAISPMVEWGGFYSGSRQRFALNTTFRFRPGVIVYLFNELNKIDLPEGRFTTRLYRLTPELQFNQFIAFVNMFQYDNVSGVFGWQSRFRWILTPGTDLYIVNTQNWLDDPLQNRFTPLDRRAATKFLYTFRF